LTLIISKNSFLSNLIRFKTRLVQKKGLLFSDKGLIHNNVEKKKPEIAQLNHYKYESVNIINTVFNL
jgi:hypothetical protein